MNILLSYKYYQDSKVQSLNEDQNSSYLISLVLDQHLQKIVKTMHAFSTRPLLVRAVKERNVEKAKIHIVSLIKNTSDIASLIITDKEGTLWSSYPERPEITGTNLAHREWYKGVSKDWKVYLSNVTLRLVGEKDTAFQIAVPIFDESGKVVGIMMNTQRTIEFSKIMKQINLDPGTYVHVTDRAGNLVYSSRFAYEKEITPYPFYFAKEKVISAKKNSVLVQDPYLEGRNRYITYTPIADIAWSVFIGRDSRTILMDGLTYYIQTTVISLLLFILIISSLVYLRKKELAQQHSEKLESENKLLISEKRFQELFKNMTSGVAIYETIGDGEDFIILDLNETGQRITKVYSDFIGKSVCDVFPGIKQSGLFEIFQRVWRTGQSEFLSSQYVDEHLTFSVENHAYKLPSGDVVAVFDDVTERKNAEDKLQRLTERLNLALETGRAGTWTWDIISGDIEWSSQMFDLFGLDPSKNTASFAAWESVLHPQDLEMAGSRTNQALANHEGLNSDYRVVLPDGEIRWINATGKGNYDERGQPIRMLGICMDITECKLGESQREALLEEIKKLNSELEQRIAMRTAELSARTAELEKANKVFIGRELRMRELKASIAELEKKT